MKIAIMSDSHDNLPNLEKAVEMANDEGCETLLHAGDLISPPALKVLFKFKGKVKFVWGNNEGEKVGLTRMMDESENVELAGDIYEDEIDEVKIFMNHYPKNAELAAKSGEYDLCIHGHTHEYFHKMDNETILLNPGEIYGYGTGEAGFVIFDTETSLIDRLLIE